MPHPTHPLPPPAQDAAAFFEARAEGRLSKKRGADGGLPGGLQAELDMATQAEMADEQV